MNAYEFLGASISCGLAQLNLLHVLWLTICMCQQTGKGLLWHSSAAVDWERWEPMWGAGRRSGQDEVTWICIRVKHKWNEKLGRNNGYIPQRQRVENYTGLRGGMLSQSGLIPITNFHTHFKHAVWTQNVSYHSSLVFVTLFTDCLLAGYKICSANTLAAPRKKIYFMSLQTFHHEILQQIPKNNMVKLRMSKTGGLFCHLTLQVEGWGAERC